MMRVVYRPDWPIGHQHYTAGEEALPAASRVRPSLAYWIIPGTDPEDPSQPRYPYRR